MTISQLTSAAYAGANPVRAPRTLEYDLLARATQRLTQAWRSRRTDFPGLVSALAENQQLWSALAVDVAGAGNGLPPSLRAQLFYLYEFTSHQSRQILDGKAGVDALIDINTAVMRGLRGDAGGSNAG
ncbi:flagellar biosynthesis regulator FlaF [Neotabrizicola shimadae]|uniref:Flagellar biosynthesis regulator FlaF n=1 Tax=Neotabrizicola shimadae TaxID=2807096 RepID=A0A8G1ED88_9RHOB|nr:flagellar biosynthesis regulator FlaF [Neotabrizicola shimadae]QYZ69956.1 flagellar biosynthesis regulator FlaF [Neotabrizicola shimadae]